MDQLMELPYGRCLALLSSQSVGRVAITAPDGPADYRGNAVTYKKHGHTYRAMVTPSFVIVGAPHFLSSTT